MNKIVLMLVAVVLLVAGCAQLPLSGPNVIRIPEARIQQQLNAQFPMTRSFLGVFDVTLRNPRVHLEDGSNRVRLGVDAVLNLRGGHGSVPLAGTIDFDTGVKYVPRTGEFFLVDPQILDLKVQDVSGEQQVRMGQTFASALRELLDQYPVYTLKATDPNSRAARLMLRSVRVDGTDLVLQLGLL